MFSTKDAPDPDKKIAQLSATYVNGLALGLSVVGGFAPIFSAIYAAEPLAAAPWQIAAISVVCFAVSAALHLAARRYLKQELNK